MNSKKIAGLFVLIGLAAACGVSMLPSKDEWYARHYFLMQDFEKSAYKGLTPNGRLEFQGLFWAVRSPVAKKEYDVRMAYINEEFKSENSKQPWNTDRARVYLLNGSPAGRDYTTNEAWGLSVNQGGAAPAGFSSSSGDRANEDIQARSLEVWTYPFGQYVVAYGFAFSPPSKWKQAAPSATAGRFVGQLEVRNKIEVWGAQNEDSWKAKLEELKSIK